MNVNPRLSVIVPTFRSLAMLRLCADGLLASDLPRTLWEFIVVDDGSRDDTVASAKVFADVVLEVADGPKGPAIARNLGAGVARGDVLVFIDSDVVVAPTTLSGFVTILDNQPAVSAVFGAYDATPAYQSFISQYRNLLHRYVHLQHRGDASSFWAGCGAVRRDVFLEVGGFDGARYPRPQIEDIELGYRMREHRHRILLDPTLTGTHLKRWSFMSVMRTDFRDRAVPWMHLLLERNNVSRNKELNLGVAEKLYTLCTALATLCIFLMPFDKRFGLGAIIFPGVVILGNANLFAWFAKQRGWMFALGVIPLRILYYIVSGLGAAWAIATHRLQPRFASPASLPNHHRRTALS